MIFSLQSVLHSIQETFFLSFLQKKQDKFWTGFNFQAQSKVAQ